MLSSVKSDRMSSVFAHNLHRYKSVWILYSLMMFLLMPASLLLSFLSNPHSHNIYIPTEILFHLLAFGMSAVLPLIIFHYINNRQAVDVFHSLPISRKNLFWGNYLFGLAVLLTPYLLFGAPSIAAQMLINRDADLKVDYLLLLMALICFYSTMVLMMVNCGTLFESITYFGIFHFGYPLFVLTAFSFISANTYGYPRNTINLVSEILYSLSPTRQILHFQIDWQPYSWWKPLVLLVIAVGAAFLGVYLYQKRKSESAGQSFAYTPLFYIGSLLISITVGLGFVLAFGSKQVFAYILGILFGLAAYFVLDTIRNRGFRKITQTAIVGCTTAVLATALFTTVNLTHTFGYETYVPPTGQVQSVSIQWNCPSSSGPFALDNEVVLYDRESIAAALSFQKGVAANIELLKMEFSDSYLIRNAHLINEESEPFANRLEQYVPYAFDDGIYSPTDYGTCRVQICYTLRNGWKVQREYNRLPFALTKPLYDIAQSPAYKEAFLDWFQKADFKNCQSVLLSNSLNQSSTQSSISYPIGKAQAPLLEQAILADLEQREPSVHLTPSQSPKGFLELTQDDGKEYRFIRIPVYPEDQRILSFLEENGYAFLEPSIEEVPSAAYIPKEELANVMAYPQKDGQMFFRTGLSPQYGEWIPDKSDSVSPYIYVPQFYDLTQQRLDSILSMVTPIYLTETPHDTVILNGTNYLVYPQYEEEVRKLVESGEPVAGEEEFTPANDIIIY